MRGLGADAVVDHRATPLAALGRFDVILNTAGSDHRPLRRPLRPGGRMVAITIDMDRRLASLGYILGSSVHGAQRVRIFRGDPGPELLTEIAELAESGDLRPVVDGAFPLERIADAHRVLEAGGVLGKVVVEVARPEAG